MADFCCSACGHKASVEFMSEMREKQTVSLRLVPGEGAMLSASTIGGTLVEASKLVGRHHASAFEDTLAGDFRPFGDEVLLVDPILVTVCVGDRAALTNVFLDINDIEDGDDDLFGVGLHGTSLSAVNLLGIHSGRILCHVVLRTRGHVSRGCPAVRTGPAGRKRRPSANWAAVFVWNQSLDIQGGWVYISHIKYMVETIGGQDDW